MFLHLGNNISVPVKDIVAILDKDSLEASKENNSYINKLKEIGHIKNEDVKNKKSYVIVCSGDFKRGRKKEENCFIYLSNISSTTLLKRYKEKLRLEVK